VEARASQRMKKLKLIFRYSFAVDGKFQYTDPSPHAHTATAAAAAGDIARKKETKNSSPFLDAAAAVCFSDLINSQRTMSECEFTPTHTHT
jgi:hypothetical protein